MRFVPGWVIVVAVVLGAAGTARADAPLVMDEPTSGLHLEVEEACQVRPADGGGAACRDFAASADKSDRFAVVLGERGLLAYSVAIFAERERGVGEARARLVSAKMGESVVGTPAVATFGDQAFLRAELKMPNGAAICFITADDSPEVAVIMFASAPESFSAMVPKVDAAMRTVRRTKRAAATATPTPTPTMSGASQALLSAFLVVLFGLPVYAFIARAVRNARRREGAQAKQRPKR